jgi:hypothetical protein
MTGETSLQRLLATMRAKLSDRAFAFATAQSVQDVPSSVNAIGTFVEEEGVTIIAPVDEIEPTNLDLSAPWAMISLTVHSSLSAVGLTARIATALAKEGISANMIAGYYHDHIFVPWDKRDAAMLALDELGKSEGN